MSATKPTIQILRGPADDAPILADGEPGWTTDTHRLLIGQDGANYPIGGGTITGGGDAQNLAVWTDTEVLADSIMTDDGSAVEVGGDLTVDGEITAVVEAVGDIVTSSDGSTLTNFPVGTDGYVLTADSTQPTGLSWTAGGGGGSGTVTSVGLSLPAELTVTGSPVTSSGILAAAWAVQSAGTIFAVPQFGTHPQFINMQPIHLPSASNGQLAIGTGTGMALGTLTAGTGISITNGSGTITITNTGSGSITGSGTTNTLTKWTGSTAIGNSGITDNGTTVTVDEALTITGALTQSTGAVSLTGNGASSFTTTSGSNTIDAKTALNLGNTNATSIAIGNGSITTAITGTLTISNALGVAYGGTGNASTTAYGLIAGGTTSTGAFQNIGTGSPGQVPFSNGSSALATWANFNGGFAPGTILAYGSSTAPPGWLTCDGTSYSTTGTYAALFGVIGYTYGGSSSFFNVPDLRGRTAIGQGTGAGTATTLQTSKPSGTTLSAWSVGQWVGEETHTLSANESGLPSHTHALTSGASVASVHGTNELAGGTAANINSDSIAANTAAPASVAHNTWQPSLCVNYIICATGSGSSTFNASYPARAEVFSDSANAVSGSSVQVFNAVGSQNYNFYAHQGSGSGTNGDTVSSSFQLQGGSYSMQLLYVTGSASGKVDIYLDGVKVVSALDAYSLSTAFNVFSTNTVAVNSNGVHTVSIVVNGHNASSSGYLFSWTHIAFFPSTDQTNIAPPSQLGFCQDFRLSASQTNAVTTTDQTTVSTLYMVPSKNISGLTNNNGGVISLFYLGSWGNYQATSVSLSLSGLSGAYDIFAYWSGSAITMAATAWTNSTTRATALALQDGQIVLSTNLTMRYLGSIYCNNSGSTEDSHTNRFIWNYTNQVQRKLLCQCSTTSYSSTAVTWENYCNTTSNTRVNFFCPTAQNWVEVSASGTCISSATNGSLGIGIDSSATNSADLYGDVGNATNIFQLYARYSGYPSLGLHYLQMLETCQSNVGVNFYGADTFGSVQQVQAGMSGWIMG